MTNSLLLPDLSVAISPAQAAGELLKRRKANAWPSEYYNSDTGKRYKFHHEAERHALKGDTPRYVLAKGGEGGGKSVWGIIKTLERIRRGLDGIMVSPDLPHFKRSLWPEFRRWCPWNQVVPSQRYRSNFVWEPHRPFMLSFVTGATLFCGGIDDPGAWEGPNVNFAFFDEARRKKTPAALKVLDGRVRIVGRNRVPPQLFIATTPRKHWLFEYFGPMTKNDPRELFKRDALIFNLLTVDNEENLEPDFARKRAQTLNEKEKRVLLDAEWEDIEDTSYFLPSMSLWDLCYQELAPLTKREPLIVAMDAATGRKIGYSDCFGILGVTRHPDKEQHGVVAVRGSWTWRAKPGGIIDFQGTEARPGPERILRGLCDSHNVLQIAYDKTQLHDMAHRLRKEGISWVREFPQGTQRLVADRQLLDLIIQRRMAHTGDRELREHLNNADRKLTDEGKKLRLMKREESLPIDLAVCLSMASYECLRLNI